MPYSCCRRRILQYRGWKKGIDPEPQSIINKRKSFQLALKEGVTICMGGDVGVFAHGDNAREMEMMVEYGMNPIDVIKISNFNQCRCIWLWK